MQAFVPTPARDVVILRIAEGGMGYIELIARQEGSFSRLFARKRLHPQFRADPTFQAMFRDEARLSGLVRHPNVASVLEIGEDDQGPFLLMEYVDGASIGQLLELLEPRDRLLPLALCVSIAAQTARGLHAAHQLVSLAGTSLGLVHRDISPKNLLVGYDGLLRIVDFGIAKAKDNLEQTKLGVLKGNLGYMAPEYLSFREVDHRSDLFALGIVLYEMLTRERLYEGDDTAAIARRILEEPAPDVFEVRDIPPELSELLFDLLAKDPELRPASALEVAGKLDVLGADLAAMDGPFDVAAFLESELAPMRKARKAVVDSVLCESRAREPSPATEAGATAGTPAIAPPDRSRVARKALLVGLAVAALIAATVAVRSSQRARVRFEPGSAALWAGGSHNCALRDERLACWGSNIRGELGDLSLETRSTAVVANIEPVRAAVLGEYHTCALTLDGRTFCWGRNVVGEIGRSAPRLTSQPLEVTGLGTATALASGRQHVCALFPSRKVSCWGANESGQLGRPASADAQPPAEVNGLPPVARIVAGGANTCAFLLDGGVRCWGANEGGQLGDGTRSARATPTPLRGAENLVNLAIGNNARAGSANPDLTKSAGFMCAVQRDGGVSCWGSNNTGQLGDGTREDRPTPVAVLGVSDALEVSVGNQHACALRKGGGVACWGRNEFGSVGDANMGPSTISLSAVAAIGIDDAVGLALGGTHSCARRRNGGILCWGVNNFGQLGDGSKVLHPVPHAASDFP